MAMAITLLVIGAVIGFIGFVGLIICLTVGGTRTQYWGSVAIVIASVIIYLTD